MIEDGVHGPESDEGIAVLLWQELVPRSIIVHAASMTLPGYGEHSHEHRDRPYHH